MSAFEQIALAWQALTRSLAQLAHPATWWPWLLLGALQASVTFLLWNFAHPLVSPVMAPLVRALGGEDALHYPGLFGALPGMAATLDLAIGALPGAVAIGAATRLFEARFLGRSLAPFDALAEAGRRAPALIAAQFPLHLLAIGLGLGLGGWLESHTLSGFVRAAGTLVVMAGTLLAQALFFYVVPLVMLERRSPWSALRELPRTWRAGLWAALALAAVLLLALLPFQFFQERAGWIAERGRPELLVALALVQTSFTLLLWYALAGSATLIYLAAPMRADDTETPR